MEPAPKTVALNPPVVPRSTSATVPGRSRSTGSIDIGPPVDAFSVTAGFAGSWLAVGASLSLTTDVPSVTALDQVSPGARLPLMSLAALKMRTLSAARTDKPPGVPL